MRAYKGFAVASDGTISKRAARRQGRGGRVMTARTLAAGAAAVFGVALLSAGLAYAIAGCLLAWWLLVDLGRAEA